MPDSAKTPDSSNSPRDEHPTPADIPELYWDYILTEEKPAANVYAFCKHCGIDESTFYQQASSFQSIEARFWESCIRDTVEVLEKDEDYPDYDLHNKLLAFFFTFFSIIQPKRSRLLLRFPHCSELLPGSLQKMYKAFSDWADPLITQATGNEEIADRKKLNQYYSKGLFFQLRMVIDYYKKDSSEQFQDTDALIEKSIRLFIDSSRSGALDSAIDLTRFLLRHLTTKH